MIGLPAGTRVWLPEFDSLSQEIRPHSNRNKDLEAFF